MRQNSSNRRIKIDVPDRFTQVTDEGIWNDLEEYVFTGMLWCRLNLSNRVFILKTVNHHEMRSIHRLCPDIESKDFRILFIAYSILEIDGQNFLVERHNNISKVRNSISKLEDYQIDKIAFELSYLHRRASKLHNLIEFYVHETKSRFRWISIKNQDITSTSSTGIVGTDKLGYNYCQMSWSALNEMLDRRDIVENEWNNAKFIGSCWAGKHVRTVDDQDKARKEKDIHERDIRKREALQEYISGSQNKEYKKENLVRLPDGRSAEVVSTHKLESVKELASALQNSLNGEKDWHDSVIEREQKRARERQEEISKRSLEWARGTDIEELADLRDVRSSMAVGGKAAADAILSRMRANKLKKLHALANNDSAAFDEK